MSSRFYLASPPESDHATLGDSEAHHLLHVLRARLGDSLTLFDGSGAEYSAEIVRLGRSTVDVRVLETRLVDRELPRTLVMGVALPKGDRQRWLVEKIVELGVTRCIPLSTTRGVVQPEGGTLDKLRRAVIEASKQCGRNRLLEIDPPQTWNDFLRSPPTTSLRRVAHPPHLWPAVGAAPPCADSPPPTSSTGETLASWTRAVEAADPARAIWLAVGPEGGFTDEEIERAVAAGWHPVGLGPRILRIETAAIGLAAATAAACESGPQNRG